MAKKNFFELKAKTWIVLATLLLIAAGVVYDLYFETPPQAEEEIAEPAIDTSRWQLAPDFAFITTDGTTHRLSDFRGKIVLIDFWATWCSTCVIEFPSIVQFVNKHQGDIVLIALSSDSDLAPIHDFIAKQKPEVQVALQQPFMHIALDMDRTITRKTFLTDRYPETIFVATNGLMVKKVIGITNWDRPDIEHFLSALKKLGNS